MSRSELRDLRDVPFFMVGTDASQAIRAAFKGKRRTSAVAVYQALVERANEARSQRFRSTRKAVGEYAGTTPRTVDEYVAEFERMGLLRVTRERTEDGLNLPNLWELLSVEPSRSAGGSAANNTTPSAAKRTRGGAAKRTQRQEERQEERQETTTKSDAFGADVERLCSLMVELSNERADSRRFAVTPTWRREMDRLLRIDGRSAEQVEYVIRWVHADAFWGPNVLAVPKLREKFDALVARIKAEGNGTGRKSVGSSPDELRAAAARARAMGQ